MSTAEKKPRNPGPNWGFGFLLWAERWWPRWFFRPALMAGTWVGLACMPAQRAHSRDYLSIVMGRAPRLIDVWRHFLAFSDSLMLKLRTSRGVPVTCQLEPPNKTAFEQLLYSDRPALFGTFHFGCSDLLGYMLTRQNRRVSILRLQVENSNDTRMLRRQFGERISFLWINQPANLLFDLKGAIESGESIAMKCDRLVFSSKTAAFQFLGARRVFPFTIYYLAILFSKPVAFCTAIDAETNNAIKVFASPIFTPDPAADRDQNLEAARAHFQGVLNDFEILLKKNPYLWFNFLPLNPVVEGN